MGGEGDGLRRFVRAAAIGSVLALVADVALLSAGSAGLTGSDGAPAMLLDVQARAFLHGHLAVDPVQAGIEGFVTHGKTYVYFGPVTSLLHLPFLALGGRGVDGHLTQLSMVAAYVALLAATALLHWRVRALLRPSAPFGRTDAAAALLLAVAVGAGAIPLYLAGWVAVYHEVELWGAALTIATLAVLVGFLRAPTMRGAVWVGVLATLAINTRVSVGLGAVAAVAAVASALGVSMLATRLSAGGRARPGRLVGAVGTFAPSVAPGRRSRLVVALLVAALVPIVSSAAINELKFAQPFGPPLERQVLSHVAASRKAALAANPGGLFGMKFVPTTLLAYLRPDAVGAGRAFPFVSTPDGRPTVIGNLRFDTLEPSLSATTSMLLFCLLSLVALVGLLRPPSRRPLFAVFVTSSVGLAGALTLAYVTTRYLADFLPTLVLGAAAGLQLLVGRTAVAGAPARRQRRMLLVAMAVLVLVGFVINGAAGLLTQQLLHPQTPMAARADFVRFQDDVDRWLGRSPHGIRTGPALPDAPVGAPGDLFVVGRCAGLYTVPLNGTWLPVERTAATGLHRLSVRFPGSTGGRWQPLVTVGSGASRMTVDARGGARRMTFRARIAGHAPAMGRTTRVPSDRAVPVVISTEPLFGPNATTVTVGGRMVVFAGGPAATAAAAIPGRDPGHPAAGPFSGTVRVLPTPTPVCRELARRARLRLLHERRSHYAVRAHG